MVAQDVTLSWNITPEAIKPDTLRPIMSHAQGSSERAL